MPKFNDFFELSIEDMELIELALHREKRALSIRTLVADKTDMADEMEANQSVRQIHDLLGRLHNQKLFYRPQVGSYVSG